MYFALQVSWNIQGILTGKCAPGVCYLALETANLKKNQIFNFEEKISFGFWAYISSFILAQLTQQVCVN